MSEVYCTALNGGGGQTAPFGALGLAVVCCEHRERDGTADVRRDRGTLEGRIRHVCPCLFPLQCFWTTAAPAPVLRFEGPIRRNVAQHELRSAPQSRGIMRYRTQLARRSALKSSRLLIFYLHFLGGVTHTAPRPHKQDIYLTDVNTNRHRPPTLSRQFRIIT